MRPLMFVPMLAVMLAVAVPAAAQQVAPADATAAAVPSADAAPIRSTLKPVSEPAGDGTQPRQRLVTVFGTDACPKPTSKDEVVVCARLPEAEVYRIPKALRQQQARLSAFQRNRNLLLGDASGGAGGAIGSCSVIGGAGIAGCTTRDVDNWARDRSSRMGATEALPDDR